MKRTKPLLLLFFIIGYLNTPAQVRWSGLGGDGQWTTPANWTGNTVPATGVDVVLDNTFIPVSYTVMLPGGNVTTTIRSLTITPTTGNSIEVVLPQTNTAPAGFTCTATGNALTINNGGIFRNASGAGSGTPVSVAGAVWISNGGRYIHNTPRPHVDLVEALATAAGTETGIFEFDIRSGSPLIAFSGRTYGTLVLSATAAGGTKTYNANGLSRTVIRGDFIMGNGVSFNVAVDDTIFIKGNYEQRGGTLNLGSEYNTVVQIGKHFIQTGGDITEDEAGLPVIELKGTTSQQVTAAGSISNSITFKVNNTTGIVLQTPLSLPYKLELTNGQVTTTATNLLTLQPPCTVSVDTLAPASFINGPVKKEGLLNTGQFLFPVGKGNSLRWMSLMNATGNYTVEFFNSSPRLKSNNHPSSIHHISSIEHWAITADASPVSQAQVKLSFNDPNSGGVGSLSDLLVAQLQGSSWMQAGNTGSAGSPGSNGFVISHSLTSFGPAMPYFTLASTSAINPLLLNPRSPATISHPTLITGVIAPTITIGISRLIFTTPKKLSTTAMITDVLGRVMCTIPMHLQKGNNIFSINTTTFPAGIYTITIPGRQNMMPPVRFIKL